MRTSPWVQIWIFSGIIATTSTVFFLTGSCKARKKSSLQSESDPYLFTGGACKTSGRWVDAAIQQAKVIESVIEGLRDNPKCGAVNNGLQNLSGNAAEVANGDDPSKSTVAQLFAVGRELTALNQYRRSSARFEQAKEAGVEAFVSHEDMSKMMSDRMFRMLGLNKDLGDSSDPKAPTQETSSIREAGQIVDQVISLKSRALRTASEGLNMAATVFNNMADDQSCLIGGSPAIGTIGIAGAKLIGAYVGADSGLSASASAAINAYFNFARKQKFNRAIRGMKDTEFLLSISCMIESTASNYCDVRDARYLQEDLLANFGDAGLKTHWAPTEGAADLMTGFRIINQDVPIVTEWLRKVVTGVTPRRSADAAYNNTIAGMQTNLWQVFNNIGTTINEFKSNFPKGDVEKRASIVSLAATINSTFMSMNNQLNTGGITLPDFYENASPGPTKLFNILGMPLPAICDPALTPNANERQDPEFYLVNGGAYDRVGDPDQLLARIDGNVQKIIDRISTSVTAFIRSNLNIDAANVATDFASPSVTGSPLKRLQQVRSYLIHLTKRINSKIKQNQAKASDRQAALMFRDTITRIDAILDAQQHILDEIDKRLVDIDDFLEKESSRKEIQLADNGSQSSILPIDPSAEQLATALIAKRQKFLDRYSGPKATAEDRDFFNSMNFPAYPGSTKKMAELFIDDAAFAELSIETAKSLRMSPQTRSKFGYMKRGPSLSLENGASSQEYENQKLYQVLLDAAYDRLDMLKFKESFFILRIAKAVYWDLTSQMAEMEQAYKAAQKNPAAAAAYQEKWAPVTRNLMMMADNFVIDRLNELIPKDLQASMIDQSKAVVMNQANLKAMEVFSDPLMKGINGLASVVEGKTSEWEIQKDLVSKTVWNPFRALRQMRTGETDRKVRSELLATSSTSVVSEANLSEGGWDDERSYDAFAGQVLRYFRPDLYWSPYYFTDSQRYKDDEFGSLATFKSLLCIQTLSFADPKPFYNLCKGTYLRSVFEKKGTHALDRSGIPNSDVVSYGSLTLRPEALSISYDEWYQKYLETETSHDRAALAFQGDRICVLKNNLRNNTIHMMKLQNRSSQEVLDTIERNQGP